ncbi:Pre-mRNA-splicing ATP-dependent RNA helicase prp28 [Taphrina deformans PYCC 5710]|uniref:RNA helicase n=1 Tax=Taphrina deformans (strain PYCC 5710 / ATCC 11124 / CBS 356.35 / IMI 108563 / JCM 9778 / NBRC 8474) TaxID=1097556 RepID=R4XCG3_TAPDE|nr:Pre-mRNA-splicing ATP-dependent RNA helicase prp28 [Taphrina deformans PYCC 5710]|eukprot:CCG83511.1 Pre-mRNA-splicing ATP-dependent RNA helicase prp28 [Taphrina deformans PYCC 5710]
MSKNTEVAKIPLDVKDLLTRTEELQKRKPKFLSTAERAEQRAAIALQKRAQTVEIRKDQRSKSEAEKQNKTESFLTNGQGIDFGYPKDERKQKKRRINDVRKFTFDWDGQDDTSDMQNPLNIENHIPQNHKRVGGHDSITSGHASDDKTRGNAPVVKDVSATSFGMPRTHARNIDLQHWTEKSRAQMKERDWRIFKEDYNIQIKGISCANPIRSWSEAEFPPAILSVIESNGYKEPTAIQKATIPIALSSRDMIGIAETGSGKTASFVLPMLVHISNRPPLQNQNRNDGPYALVLAPTRELAQQIELETRKFASVLNMTVVSIVGGHSIEEQAFNLRDGAEIIIATPGRLLDCLERHVLVLSQCRYVVMDEADRMVDLGFEDAVNEVLDSLPLDSLKSSSGPDENTTPSAQRQTVMFSATMPTAVEKLARKYLRHPATVIIGNAGQVVDTVEQRVEIVNGEEKRKRRMAEILNCGEFDRPVIVFVNTKRSCDALAKYLHTIGWTSATLHGGKTQDQREAALKHLRSGEADILVATDLAGRGIDVADVSLVLNFDMSKTVEDYVHRIGRTGRAGKHGVAITFFNEEEEELHKAVQALTKKNLQAD